MQSSPEAWKHMMRWEGVTSLDSLYMELLVKILSVSKWRYKNNKILHLNLISGSNWKDMSRVLKRASCNHATVIKQRSSRWWICRCVTIPCKNRNSRNVTPKRRHTGHFRLRRNRLYVIQTCLTAFRRCCKSDDVVSPVSSRYEMSFSDSWRSLKNGSEMTPCITEQFRLNWLFFRLSDSNQNRCIFMWHRCTRERRMPPFPWKMTIIIVVEGDGCGFSGPQSTPFSLSNKCATCC